jgi:hypothetical protein
MGELYAERLLCAIRPSDQSWPIRVPQSGSLTDSWFAGIRHCARVPALPRRSSISSQSTLPTRRRDSRLGSGSGH